MVEPPAASPAANTIAGWMDRWIEPGPEPRLRPCATADRSFGDGLPAPIGRPTPLLRTHGGAGRSAGSTRPRRDPIPAGEKVDTWSIVFRHGPALAFAGAGIVRAI